MASIKNRLYSATNLGFRGPGLVTALFRLSPGCLWTWTRPRSFEFYDYGSSDSLSQLFNREQISQCLACRPKCKRHSTQLVFMVCVPLTHHVMNLSHTLSERSGTLPFPLVSKRKLLFQNSLWGTLEVWWTGKSYVEWDWYINGPSGEPQWLCNQAYPGPFDHNCLGTRPLSFTAWLDVVSPTRCRTLWWITRPLVLSVKHPPSK